MKAAGCQLHAAPQCWASNSSAQLRAVDSVQRTRLLPATRAEPLLKPLHVGCQDMEEELRPLQRLQHLAALDLSVWGLQPGAAAVVAAFPALQVRVPMPPATPPAPAGETLAPRASVNSTDGVQQRQQPSGRSCPAAHCFRAGAQLVLLCCACEASFVCCTGPEPGQQHHGRCGCGGAGGCYRADVAGPVGLPLHHAQVRRCRACPN